MHEESCADLKWGVTARVCPLWGSVLVPEVAVAVLQVVPPNTLSWKAAAGCRKGRS